MAIDTSKRLRKERKKKKIAHARRGIADTKGPPAKALAWGSIAMVRRGSCCRAQRQGRQEKEAGDEMMTVMMMGTSQPRQ
jgi:hypothetical protein